MARHSLCNVVYILLVVLLGLGLNRGNILKIILSCWLLLTSMAMPSFAEDATTTMLPSAIPIEAFARLTSGAQMKMSPSATHIAYIIPYKGRKHIMVRNLADGEAMVIPPSGNADIKWFRWKGDNHLLISYRFTTKMRSRTFSSTRLMTYNLQEKKTLLLIPESGARGIDKKKMGNVGDDIVDMLDDDPEHILLELDDDFNGDTSIYKVNVQTRIRSRILRAKFGVNNWLADKQHKPRWGTGYQKGKKIARYLNPVTNEWDEAHKKSWYEDDGIFPVKFFDDPRFAYVYAKDEKGKDVLAKFDMVEGNIVEEIFSHDTVDAGRLALAPDTGEIIGVNYTDTSPKIHFFDKTYEKLYAQLTDAFGEGDIRIISVNMAKKIFLIRHFINNSPSTIYYLDGKTGVIDFILSSNSDLPSELMADIKPIKYQARDDLTIHGYLTLPKGKEAKNLPTIIFPHGGPHARDYLSFDIWAQFFASRGYAVMQPNFRGSTGYGDHFRDLGKKQWGGAMQDDVTDATNWLIDEGIADPDKICIAGASYGGYAALMGAIKEPDLYKCSISINGVSDLQTIINNSKRSVGGQLRTESIGLEGEKLKSVSPLHQARRIKIPVLIVQSKDDPVVPLRHGKSMARKLKSLKKPVTYVEVKNGDHYLDTAETRLATFKAMEKFLAKHLDD